MPLRSVNPLPVELTFGEKLKDEDGTDIDDSDKTKATPKTNEMIKEQWQDGGTGKIPNIAYRSIHIKVPADLLKGTKVKWSMTPLTPLGASASGIRGNWPGTGSPNADRFVATDGADNYYSFERTSQAEGKSKIDDDGETEVRVNVPPVAFNKVRVKMEFEKFPGAYVELDLEVPGVVVIDPGHGGTENVAGSSANNATSPSGVLEKTMTLDFGLIVRDALRAYRQQNDAKLRIFMTRTADVNLTGAARAYKARDNGADVLFVLHFNADDDEGTDAKPRIAHQSRGTLEVARTTNNVGVQENATLSNRIIDRIVAAITQTGDTRANHRGTITYSDMPAVCSDLNTGNTQAYHPIRICYCEGEFIDFGQRDSRDTKPVDPTKWTVDILLNTGPNASALRQAIGNAIRDGILEDMKSQPAK